MNLCTGGLRKLDDSCCKVIEQVRARHRLSVPVPCGGELIWEYLHLRYAAQRYPQLDVISPADELKIPAQDPQNPQP